MAKWTMSDAMARRILERLVKSSEENRYHKMGWRALIGAVQLGGVDL